MPAWARARPRSLPRAATLTRRAGVDDSRVWIAPLPADFSARTTLSAPQRRFTVLAAVGLLFALVVTPVATLIGLIAVATAVYFAALVYRLRTFSRALDSPDVLRVSDAEARGIPLGELPTYSILVPAFQEPEVIGGLLRSIDAIEYPRDRLDVLLLLEEDDQETLLTATAAANGMRHVRIVRVPYSEPRTKPKACNYGLSLARGTFVTIYDAEDRPEPLQLRRAVAAFSRVDTTIACLQAKLSYHNVDQNLITRWFTTEYAVWFSHLLPGLVNQAAPLPLGGTSNHFRVGRLASIGAWDPHNVTEDADLGIRLHRAGYRTQVLESTTFEEANSDFVNWVKQRSRWYKGYMQTWLVHMRHPRQLYRELGPAGFIGFHLFLGGTPLLALVSPIFWLLTGVWFLGQLDFIVSLFPPWLYYVSLVSFVFGNLSMVYINMVAALAARSPRQVLAALASPLYWLMMSIAAIKALLQLVHAPSFWEKTVHGLDGSPVHPEAKRATV